MIVERTRGAHRGRPGRLRAWWRARRRPEVATDAPPLLQAHGWGGLVALYPDRISIRRIGFLHVVMDILPLHIPRVDSVIFLDTLTAIEVVRPLLLLEFVRFAYAGDPEETAGGYWSAAFADNAVMMNLLDNRRFYRLIEAANILRRGQALPAHLAGGY